MAGAQRARVDASGLLLMLSSVGCLGPRYIDVGDDDVGDDTTTSEPEPTSMDDSSPPGMRPGAETGLDTSTTVGTVSMSVGEVSSDPTAVSGTTDTPPPTPEICVAYGEQITECYMDPDSGAAAAGYCTEVLENYGQYYGVECVSALEDYLACLSSLSCEEFTGPDPVCQRESSVLEQACMAP